jgi:hypothetical protein
VCAHPARPINQAFVQAQVFVQSYP